MKTRAAVLLESGLPVPYAQSHPLKIMELELSPPGADEVLIRVRAAGLCHSDLSVIDGNRPRPLPMALGHEAAGEVMEVGANVRHLRAGDHVVAAFVPSCGGCEPCSTGRPALCEPGLATNTAGTLLSGARRLRLDGRDINHHLGVSAFAEYVVASSHSLVKIDPTLPFVEAAVFGCAVITGTGAVMNTAQMPRGATAAVIGLGGVGLAALLGARMQEATTLIALDISDAKLALATELGATHVFNARDPEVTEKVMTATRGGVQFAFEMAGSGPAMHLAYNITRRGGTTITAGLPHPNVQFSVPQVGIVAAERTIKGSYLGSCVPSRDIPRYIEWYRAGKLPIDRLVGERLSLDEINLGFDRMAAGSATRQVVVL
jgi:alcohol dehydrogenase